MHAFASAHGDFFLLCSQMPEAKDHNCEENQKIDLPELDCWINSSDCQKLKQAHLLRLLPVNFYRASIEDPLNYCCTLYHCCGTQAALPRKGGTYSGGGGGWQRQLLWLHCPPQGLQKKARNKSADLMYPGHALLDTAPSNPETHAWIMAFASPRLSR